MKVLKAINREPPGAPPNSTMQSPSGKPITTDQGKCKLFRTYFAQVSKRPPPPKGQDNKAKYRKKKSKIRKYIHRNDLTPAAKPYSSTELNIAISFLHNRKACGEDGIYNEFLINSNEKMRAHILRLINLIWETGVFP